MVGGGSRRDDGNLKISSNNVFAVLESLKKKKKSDKESSKSKGSSKNQPKEPDPQVFWTPATLNVSSWADVDDDDDYYATTAPPQSVWASSAPQYSKERAAVIEEESESEDDGLDEGDEDVEEEPEEEPEVPIPVEPTVKKPPPASSVSKDPERQLSKKELKKKELAELDDALAELGITGNNAGQEETNGVALEKKPDEQNGDGQKKENAPAPSESKTSKKKKAKKEKSSKEFKELQEQPNAGDVNDDPNAAMVTEPAEDYLPAIDVKERIKKVSSIKKKKSSKEMDTAARFAASEAAARSAKLAAAKKKEKNHYNQQPIR